MSLEYGIQSARMNEPNAIRIFFLSFFTPRIHRAFKSQPFGALLESPSARKSDFTGNFPRGNFLSPGVSLRVPANRKIIALFNRIQNHFSVSEPIETRSKRRRTLAHPLRKGRRGGPSEATIPETAIERTTQECSQPKRGLKSPFRKSEEFSSFFRGRALPRKEA
ncbi:hypothetical protein AVEN_238896-1 [Araneus ventricosus]|uniref:Uncharacterized protein n=1 Tax=Araneus ventricosus TaxID=182803 RepID=A0A4Y2X2V6_ARAVE|nr:hypothetical protein AVEN_238896-1 [Araneus ventricosus]